MEIVQPKLPRCDLQTCNTFAHYAFTDYSEAYKKTFTLAHSCENHHDEIKTVVEAALKLKEDKLEEIK